MGCTALLPASARVPAWGLLDAAYLVVFGAVILTASAGASLIVTDALIERFGTLTIIVLGEILTSVVAGLASQPLSGLSLSVGLVAVVLCATILVSASLQPRHGDPALHQLLTRSCIPVAAACLGLGAARPAPLLLCVALVVLLGVPWVLAVAHHLAKTSGSPGK
jgi:hypothetical protein